MVGSKGFNQQYGLHIVETFGPVVKIKTVHVRIDIIAGKGLKFKHMKVKDAFQHGGVHMEIYSKHTNGFEDQ